MRKTNVFWMVSNIVLGPKTVKYPGGGPFRLPDFANMYESCRVKIYEHPEGKVDMSEAMSLYDMIGQVCGNISVSI